ncbi:MAG: hypothetical protein AAGE52_09480 [Myxococcota bacterium]
MAPATETESETAHSGDEMSASAEPAGSPESGDRSAQEPTPEILDQVRANLADIVETVGEIESVGAIETPAGWLFAFKARLQDDTEEPLYLAFALPTEEGHEVVAMDLGTTEFVPGAEFTTDLESFGGLQIDQGFVRGEFVLRSAGAEFATDGECEERVQEPTTRTAFVLLCREMECRALARERSIVEPGFEQDCDGAREPYVDMPETYSLDVAIEDEDHVRLTPTSGTSPWDQHGVVPLADLSGEGLKRGI